MFGTFISLYLLSLLLTIYLLTGRDWRTRGSRIFCVILCLFAPVSLLLISICCIFYYPYFGIKVLIKWIKEGKVKIKENRLED